MTTKTSRSKAIVATMAIATFLNPHGAEGEEENPPIVQGEGKCESLSLDEIPLAQFGPPIPEPLAPWKVTQKYNATVNYYALGHNGLDLGGEFAGAVVGVEKIRASFGGRVIVSNFSGGWGNSIAIVSRVHPSSKALVTTHYHHLDARYVAHCDTTDVGQLIGREGKTGGDWAAHLHFTVRYWASWEHLSNWLSKANGDYLVFGNDAYFGKDGLEFRGSYDPSPIKKDSPYFHYGFIDPESLVKDYFVDYQLAKKDDPPLPHAWSAVYAKKMRHYGIELGEWNGAFGALMPVQRREAARWLRAAVGEQAPEGAAKPQIFKDVPTSDPDYPYIQTLAQHPLETSVIDPTRSCVQGEGVTFCPNATIIRAEALKMAVLSFYPDEFHDFYKTFFWFKEAVAVPAALAKVFGIPVGGLFSDVPIASWYAPYVYFGALHGFVAVQAKFNPEALVLRAEMAKWVVLGHEKLQDKNLADLCVGVACTASEYCDPQSGSCVDKASCVPSDEQPCEVGGGLDPDAPGCPNGACQADETCMSCPEDCGACPEKCQNGVCDAGETCSSCADDCGVCPAGCPDGACSGGETCNSCPQDCGACPANCPDGSCGGGETCDSCPQDCGACPADCPDGSCGGGETCQSCPQDCGACPAACPDGKCNGNETCNSCPQDCGDCGCQEANYWSPAATSDVDGVGAQANATINVGVSVEVKESGAGLEARVCKPGGIFDNNVAFSIYDAATDSNVGIDVASLATSGQSCSPWIGLKNDLSYTEGQQFGGTWQVVSPTSSAGDWKWPYNSCPANANATGTCWNGIDLTMTRTCK